MVTRQVPASRVQLPSAVVPERKATLPLGKPDPPESVAVKVTALPGRDGFLEVRRLIVGTSFGGAATNGESVIVLVQTLPAGRSPGAIPAQVTSVQASGVPVQCQRRVPSSAGKQTR